MFSYLLDDPHNPINHHSYALKSESAPLELSEDAAVVLRLVCKPSSSLQEIGFTLESITKVRVVNLTDMTRQAAPLPTRVLSQPLTSLLSLSHSQAAEGIKAQSQSTTVQIEIIGAPHDFTHAGTFVCWLARSALTQTQSLCSTFPSDRPSNEMYFHSSFPHATHSTH